ncbi:MAG: hypothetical protein RIE73_35265 [Coleofasciculus sp. C1-SOL-03]|jgi:hypothetical protein|uniref:hypothetical protein n=1 Tax=Coleofasciculus sp. C1-SOL-03 TaxID=3069522 RepID=UPI0032FF9AA9
MSDKTYLTKTAVLERGWTKGAIRKFLGQADKTSPNPYSRKKPPVQLFDIQRVKQCEESSDFAVWKKKISKRRQAAQQTAKRKKQGIEYEKSCVAKAWEQLNPLSNFRTSDWTDFTGQHLGILEGELTDREKEIAVNAVRKMLKASYWIPVDLLFDAFNQWGLDAANTDEYAATIADSIAEYGWKGIPLVSFFLKNKMGRVQLDSGHHRWIALKRLRDTGKIGADFRVPVFDLDLMPSCFEEKRYRWDAIEALSYLENGDYGLALKIYGRENWMLGLCSGIDC